MIAGRLLGTWKLVTYENKFRDGETRFPMGPGALGFIIYGSAGYMSVNLMSDGFLSGHRGETPPLFDDSVTGLLSLGYIAYSGRFDVDEERQVVRHHIELSLAPELLKGPQERHVRFIDGDLELSVPSSGDTDFSTALLWQRA